MDLGIAGETALLVGASEGIGFESAKALLEEDAQVFICSRSEAKLKTAAAAPEAADGAAASDEVGCRPHRDPRRGVSAEDIVREFSAEIPMGRFGEPQEIAAMVAFLASHKASYVNCQSILVDGGIARGLI
ncbi:MAG: SDR family oxidoreductase [Burkholderiales bacterium]